MALTNRAEVRAAAGNLETLYLRSAIAAGLALTSVHQQGRRESPRLAGQVGKRVKRRATGGDGRLEDANDVRPQAPNLAAVQRVGGR